MLWTQYHHGEKAGGFPNVCVISAPQAFVRSTLVITCVMLVEEIASYLFFDLRDPICPQSESLEGVPV